MKLEDSEPTEKELAAMQYKEWMARREVEYYTRAAALINDMSDDELQKAYADAMLQLRERQEEVMRERRAGYSMDAPQMTRYHQMIYEEHSRRQLRSLPGYCDTVAGGPERWTR